jgi:hypothetical protein
MGEMLEGGCHCGAVRYRITSDPIYVNGCHCRDCQTLTGSAFAINAMIEDDRIEIVKGDPVVDAEGCIRCATCNVLLWASHPMFGDSIRFLRVGTLDRSEAMVPDGHFFVRSKHPWITIPDGVPAFETLPGEGERVFSAAQQARVTAAMGG